jgi:hypothetical protein
MIKRKLKVKIKFKFNSQALISFTSTPSRVDGSRSGQIIRADPDPGGPTDP